MEGAKKMAVVYPPSHPTRQPKMSPGGDTCQPGTSVLGAGTAPSMGLADFSQMAESRQRCCTCYGPCTQDHGQGVRTSPTCRQHKSLWHVGGAERGSYDTARPRFQPRGHAVLYSTGGTARCALPPEAHALSKGEHGCVGSTPGHLGNFCTGSSRCPPPATCPGRCAGCWHSCSQSTATQTPWPGPPLAS